jgi:DNA-binding MarR family transcriptional regulator
MIDESKRLHTSLIYASLAHKKRSRQRFRNLDLSDGQPKILSILLQKDGCLQKDLSNYCHIEPATLTSVLRNMLNKELVYKQPLLVSGGKRAFAIYLTQKGRSLAQQVNTIVSEIEEISFKDFTEEEKHLLISLLSRLQNNLEEA